MLILQKFRSWVASSLVQIMVMTDHESLQHWYTEDLNKATSSVGRRCRWHEFLSQFNLVVIYVPGHTQKVADPLSRAPWYYPGNPDEGDATFHGPIEARQMLFPAAAMPQKTSLTISLRIQQSSRRSAPRREAGVRVGSLVHEISCVQRPLLLFSFANGIILMTLFMVRFWTEFVMAKP